MEQFRNELALIKDDNIRVFTVLALDQAPRYWWTQESSKKHHYKDERKKGGRVKHARRCAKLAVVVAEALSVDPDLLISASLLHDICVRGVEDTPSSDRALPDHGLLVEKKLADLINHYQDSDWLQELIGLIESHMGKWGTIQPNTRMEAAFHLIDLIASRDFVKIEV